MPSLVVRNLDESIVIALKERAVAHQRSTEAEHRAILADVLSKPKRKSFAEALLSIPHVGNDTDFERIQSDTPAPMYLD